MIHRTVKPGTVKVQTVGEYTDRASALADKTTLGRVRILAWINGTAARGYTLIVRDGDGLNATKVLAQAKAKE